MTTWIVTLTLTVIGNVGLIAWKWNDPSVLAKVAEYQQQRKH